MLRNIIYGLECPNTGKVYYVGISEHGLDRPYEHLKKSHSSNDVRDWVLSLNGQEPVICILERDIDKADLRTRQQYWISTMLQRKEPLFNRMIPAESQLRFYDYRVGEFIKEQRRKNKLTQRDFANKSGLGLRFVRDIEQGKESCRMDKVLQALMMFGATLVPVVKH